MSSPTKLSTQKSWGAVLFALAFPTFVTVVYFDLLAGESAAIQQTAYTVGKIIQFLFPIVWAWRVERLLPRLARPRSKDLLIGMGFGLAMTVPALILYFTVLKPAGIFAASIGPMQVKTAGLGVKTPVRFTVVALGYTAIHSLAEEYYFRWFVFGRLRQLVLFATASAVAAFGFTAHHVFVLADYFGWTSPITYMFSAAVAFGGVVWGWMYEKSGSLYGAWIAHACVDAGIFVIGYDLIGF